MDWKVLLGLIFSYFVYLLIGAAVFQAIERPAEEEQCKEVQEAISLLRSRLENATANVTVDDVGNVVELLQTAASFGVEVDRNFNVTCIRNWDFQSAFFFSGTVVTTIGYGNISPTTSLGRSICIIYALLGLPLFGLMFSGLGELFANGIKKLDARISGRAKRTWVGQIILVLVVLALFLTFCMLVPAAIFMAVEEWTYHDSFYYSFITLTTIGFGDFVIGTNPDIQYIPIYRVLVYFWIVFGIAFMATVISLISDFWKKTGEKARQKQIGAEEVDGDEEAGDKDGEREENESEEDGRHVKNQAFQNGNTAADKSLNSSTESLEKHPLNAQSVVNQGSELEVENNKGDAT